MQECSSGSERRSHFPRNPGQDALWLDQFQLGLEPVFFRRSDGLSPLLPQLVGAQLDLLVVRMNHKASRPHYRMNRNQYRSLSTTALVTIVIRALQRRES